MAIRIVCPECGKSLKVRDEVRGRKVGCTVCRGAITVPTRKRPRPDDDDEQAVQERPKVRIAPGRSRDSRRNPDDDYDSPSARRKARNEKKGAVLRLIRVLGAQGVGRAALFVG